MGLDHSNSFSSLAVEKLSNRKVFEVAVEGRWPSLGMMQVFLLFKQTSLSSLEFLLSVFLVVSHSFCEGSVSDNVPGD